MSRVGDCPKSAMQAISPVGRLGVIAVTDGVVELTAHNFVFVVVEVTVDITALIALPGCYLCGCRRGCGCGRWRWRGRGCGHGVSVDAGAGAVPTLGHVV